MNTSNLKFRDVNHYISGFPSNIQVILKKIRATIKKAAPKADERISYGMPFYEYGGKGYEGRLIYFAAFKKHISLFITPRHNETIPNELKQNNVSKATYQFTIDKPIPFSLIEKAVRAMVKERDTQNKKASAGKGTSTGKKQNAVVVKEITSYNNKLSKDDKAICDLLAEEISHCLPKAESKIWHAHPVWFLDGNPITGYSKEKRGIRMMFWSGASFDESGLEARGGKFKDASVFYNDVSEINTRALKRWLKKSKDIQWDYKNIVKRRGVLERLKG